MAPPSAGTGTRLRADNRYGIKGSPALVVVGSVVVGSVLVGVASVVVGAAVAVGAVVVVVVAAVVVVGAVVGVGVVTGGWMVLAPTVESASVILVLPAVAGAWALAGPGVVVGLLTASGTVSGMGIERVERVGAVVGSRGPVVGVDAISLPARLGRPAVRGWYPAWR
jgi:hypothetical protein